MRISSRLIAYFKPCIFEPLGSFYVEHSGLIKTLGAAALAITMARMKNNMENTG
jgi:hypothetical protein